MNPVSKTNLLTVFLFFALLASLYLVLKTTIFYGQAATVNTAPVALENSYLFASPLQAKADSQELVRITVFLLDGRGLGLPGQPVEIEKPSQLIIKQSQAVTDDAGKATFDIASPTPGTFDIVAKTGGLTLPQKVKITFN